MLTMLVEIETFSRSCGLVGTMSGGTGSCVSSPGFCPSPGRLFFFSFDVGGWRRDCEKPGMQTPITSKTERATAKNAYNRLSLIVSTPKDTAGEAWERGRFGPPNHNRGYAFRCRRAACG